MRACGRLQQSHPWKYNARLYGPRSEQDCSLGGGFCRDHHQNKRSTFYLGARRALERIAAF
jgi:hypothetical protein